MAFDYRAFSTPIQKVDYATPLANILSAGIKTWGEETSKVREVKRAYDLGVQTTDYSDNQSKNYLLGTKDKPGKIQEILAKHNLINEKGETKPFALNIRKYKEALPELQGTYVQVVGAEKAMKESQKYEQENRDKIGSEYYKPIQESQKSIFNPDGTLKRKEDFEVKYWNDKPTYDKAKEISEVINKYTTDDGKINDVRGRNYMYQVLGQKGMNPEMVDKFLNENKEGRQGVVNKLVDVMYDEPMANQYFEKKAQNYINPNQIKTVAQQQLSEEFDRNTPQFITTNLGGIDERGPSTEQLIALDEAKNQYINDNLQSRSTALLNQEVQNTVTQLKRQDLNNKIIASPVGYDVKTGVDPVRAHLLTEKNKTPGIITKTVESRTYVDPNRGNSVDIEKAQNYLNKVNRIGIFDNSSQGGGVTGSSPQTGPRVLNLGKPNVSKKEKQADEDLEYFKKNYSIAYNQIPENDILRPGMPTKTKDQKFMELMLNHEKNISARKYNVYSPATNDEKESLAKSLDFRFKGNKDSEFKVLDKNLKLKETKTGEKLRTKDDSPLKIVTADVDLVGGRILGTTNNDDVIEFDINKVGNTVKPLLEFGKKVMKAAYDIDDEAFKPVRVPISHAQVLQRGKDIMYPAYIKNPNDVNGNLLRIYVNDKNEPWTQNGQYVQAEPISPEEFAERTVNQIGFAYDPEGKDGVEVNSKKIIAF